MKQKNFLDQSKSYRLGVLLMVLGIVFFNIYAALNFTVTRDIVYNIFQAATETDILIASGIFIFLSLLFNIIARIMIKRKSERQQVIANLKEEGVFLIAEVNDCKSVREGNRTVYYLHCSHTTSEGQVFVFKSDRLRRDPTPFLDGGKVRVYCDTLQMTPYFVDIDGSVEARE